MGGPDSSREPISALYVHTDARGVHWRRVTVSRSIPLRPLERTVWGLARLHRAMDWLVLLWVVAIAQAAALGASLAAGALASGSQLEAMAGLQVLTFFLGLFALGPALGGLGDVRRDRAAVSRAHGEAAGRGFVLVVAGLCLLVPWAAFEGLVALSTLSAGQGGPRPEAAAALQLTVALRAPALMASLGASLLLPAGCQLLVDRVEPAASAYLRPRFLLFAYAGAALAAAGLLLPAPGAEPQERAPAAAVLFASGLLGPLFTIGSILIYREELDGAAHGAYRRLTAEQGGGAQSAQPKS